MASQITGVTIVYSIVCSGADQRRHQSSIGLCAENSQVTGEFPAQKASNAENVSIWWRHHNIFKWNYYEYIDSEFFSFSVPQTGTAEQYAHGLSKAKTANQNKSTTAWQDYTLDKITVNLWFFKT